MMDSVSVGRAVERALPDGAAGVLDAIAMRGGQAFVVGGCVRDCAMGRTPKDWDICSSMLPDDIVSLFHDGLGYRVVPTGIRHGTVTVYPHGSREGYEVTTFRTDGSYSDGRRPDSVAFTDDVVSDLSRRDLTMNAMAWSPDAGLVDPFHGLDDIARGTIRTVGDPDARFGEDALRMMRTIRFSAQLGFDVHPDVLAAIGRNAAKITDVAQERRTDEVMKILSSDRPGTMRLLESSGLMEYVIPEVHALFGVGQANPWHLYDVGEHTMRALENTPADPVTRLAALFHDAGKPVAKTTGPDGIDHFRGHAEISYEICRTAMRRMRFPSDTIRDVSRLVRLHDRSPEPSPRSVRRFASRYGLYGDMFRRYHDLVAADGMAQNPELARGKIEAIDRCLDVYASVRSEPMSVRDLSIDGHDAMAAGLKGPEIKRALERSLDYVLDDPSRNTREELLSRLSLPDERHGGPGDGRSLA